MGRIAQMEVLIQALKHENLTLQQQQRQQETLLRTVTRALVHNVQKERLIGVLPDLERVLSENLRVALVGVKDVGKPNVFQNDGSKLYEWTKKIEDYLIGIDPQLEVMLDWVLENETATKQSLIADKLEERRPD